MLFTRAGPLVLKNARYADDPGPPDPACRCRTCRRYSRAYLRHLLAAGEHLSAVLNTVHNVSFYLDMMRSIREAISLKSYAKYLEAMRSWPG
jgi:queuine tRNA-ribosyltransferase